MKKIIIFASLIIITQFHHSLCMKSTQLDLNIFEYLADHNRPECSVLVCKNVEMLIKDKPTRAHKICKNDLSPHCNRSPIDIAIEQRCPNCVTLLLQNGASCEGKKLITYGFVINHPGVKTIHSSTDQNSMKLNADAV